MKNLTFVLDIGSSKISLLACQVNKGKSSIITSETMQYDGFMDGEFFSTEQLFKVVGDLIAQIENRLNNKVTNLHIGVPSEFSACVCKRVKRTFVPAQKIKEQTIVELFDGINDFGKKDEFDVISFSPLQYELDGVVSCKLTNKRISQFVMDCSYILVKKSFVEIIKQMTDSLGITDIDFISTALAQAQYARKDKDSDTKLNSIAIVDIGHITTSVAVAKGEGLLMLSSFSLGGGHITADLMQVNNLGYQEADLIKRKVSLTIEAPKDEKYIVYNGDKKIKAIISITNDIVKSRLENIANVVNKILSNDTFKDTLIYLTGDGVCNFRGITNLFEVVCNRKIYILKSYLHNGEDKYQTSKVSLARIIGDLV